LTKLVSKDYIHALAVSILEIIFLNYVAPSFCEIFKLPKEMPKIMDAQV